MFSANKRKPEDFHGPLTADNVVDTAMRTASKLAKDRLGGRLFKGGGTETKVKTTASRDSTAVTADHEAVVKLDAKNYDSVVRHSSEVNQSAASAALISSLNLMVL